MKFSTKVIWLCIAFAAVFLTVFVFRITSIYAAEAKFSWLPNTESDLKGYKIHYGDKTGEYTGVVDCGLPATVSGRVNYVIADAPDELTFFAATAYDNNDKESGYSTEVTNDPAPAPPTGLTITTTTTTTTTITQ